MKILREISISLHIFKIFKTFSHALGSLSYLPPSLSISNLKRDNNKEKRISSTRFCLISSLTRSLFRTAPAFSAIRPPHTSTAAVCTSHIPGKLVYTKRFSFDIHVTFLWPVICEIARNILIQRTYWKIYWILWEVNKSALIFGAVESVILQSCAEPWWTFSNKISLQ